jgi:hypothetical protein
LTGYTVECIIIQTNKNKEVKNMLFNLFRRSNIKSPSRTQGRKQMARSTQYVVYTREFRTRAKQIGVFAEPVRNYLVNGEVHGGKIKFRNLAVKNTARKTATSKLLAKGLDFSVNVIGTAPMSSALTMKKSIISLLRKSGRKVINHAA